MDDLFRRFWWGYNEQDKRKFTPKFWKTICTPKSLGGFGLKKYVCFKFSSCYAVCMELNQWGFQFMEISNLKNLF